MGRQILIVILGVGLTYLAAAASGYFLYQLSDPLRQQAPMLVRYILNPAIAVLVGAYVGVFARSRPATLAALSLTPCALAFLFARRQDAFHFPLLALLCLVYLLIGLAVATGTLRLRRRNAPNGLVGTSA